MADAPSLDTAALQAMLDSPDLAGLTFTGSTGTGAGWRWTQNGCACA